MKILVTGFDPFGGESINPAYEAVKLLPDVISGAEIIKMEVPTIFSKCGIVIEEGIKKYDPDVVICVGQAGKRSCVTVEKVAINLAEAVIADNAGEQPIDMPVIKDGPTAYFSTLPVKAIIKNIRENGLPCDISYTAGTYVCNTLMYNALHIAAVKYPKIKAGFIHVPYIAAQVVSKPLGTPFMSLDDITRSLKYAIEAIIANPSDINILTGKTN